MVDQTTRVSPFVLVSEGLGEDISGHIFRGFVPEFEVLADKSFVEPRDVDAVGATEMSHGRVAPSFADLNASLVVLVEHNSDVASEKYLPEFYSRYALRT